MMRACPLVARSHRRYRADGPTPADRSVTAAHCLPARRGQAIDVSLVRDDEQDLKPPAANTIRQGRQRGGPIPAGRDRPHRSRGNSRDHGLEITCGHGVVRPPGGEFNWPSVPPERRLCSGNRLLGGCMSGRNRQAQDIRAHSHPPACHRFDETEQTRRENGLG